MEKTFLHLLIQWGISMETGGVVDFNQPRLQLLVEENIKSQDFKTGTAPVVIGEASAVVVLQNGMSCYQGLDDHILYVDKGGQSVE